MAETTGAASSAADEQDVFRGEQVSFDDFSKWRQNGELPARFSAKTTDAPEETVEESEGDKPEPESEPEPDEEAQEPPPKATESQKRILRLLAEKKELQRQLEAARPVEAVQQSQPAPVTRPKPTAEGTGPDGKPYATYEDYIQDVSDWIADQKIERYKQQQAEQVAMKALQVKLDDARARYADADEVIFPAAETINQARIPRAVKEVFADSEFFPDLCYVIGSDPEELKKFVHLAQSNPRGALARVFEYERGIREELAKNGKAEQAPEVKKTNAPKPPSAVTGASSRAFDVSDESLTPDEWARKRTEQLKRKGKG